VETITCDMQLAGYLLATGHRLLRVDHERRRKIFVFDAGDDAVHAFYSGAGTVSARALFSGYFQVKDLVFGNRN
jgi:hypothetical protein